MDHTQKSRHQTDQGVAVGRAHGDFRLRDDDGWELTAKGLVGALIFDLQQLMEPANQARRDLNEQEQRAVLARLQTVKWMLTREHRSSRKERDTHATQPPSPVHH